MSGGWLAPMIAAGVCSAGAIVLLRDLPRYAPDLPVLLTVAIYLLVGGGVLMVAAVLAAKFGTPWNATWPSNAALVRILAIGVMLGALEAFFVLAGRNNMPVPDAMVVYHLTSLALVTVAGVVMFGEALTTPRLIGLGFGCLSVYFLLQPVKPA